MRRKSGGRPPLMEETIAGLTDPGFHCTNPPVHLCVVCIDYYMHLCTVRLCQYNNTTLVRLRLHSFMSRRQFLGTVSSISSALLASGNDCFYTEDFSSGNQQASGL